MTRRRPGSLRLKAAAALLAAPLTCVFAQEPVETYPARPVRVIVPQAPGGGTDIQARLFAARLGEHLGRPFVVENRTGAGNTIGVGLVARSAPDGYTLLAITPSFTFQPALHSNLPYDPLRDFAPISLVTRAPYLLLVHPAVPARSVREWIALARARPGALNAGVGSNGSFTHLAMAWFADLTGTKLQIVPYKGTGPVIIDLMTGQLHTTFANVLSTLHYVKAGKMRALATSMAVRSVVLPDLPTIAESGVAGFDLNTWHGWAAPAGTPPAIVGKVQVELARAVEAPDIAGKLAADGGEAVGSTAGQFRRIIIAETARWRQVVANSRISLE